MQHLLSGVLCSVFLANSVSAQDNWALNGEPDFGLGLGGGWFWPLAVFSVVIIGLIRSFGVAGFVRFIAIIVTLYGVVITFNESHGLFLAVVFAGGATWCVNFVLKKLLPIDGDD